MQEQKIYRFFIKLLKYSLVGFSLFFVLVFSLLVVITKMYNEELKEMAFNQINAKLNTQFIANNIDVSVIDQFPNISITFSDVFIEDPNIENDTLIFTEKLYLNFNALDLLKRNYIINSISLDQGIINIQVDENGAENYLILKETDSLNNEQLSFALEQVLLNDFDINYYNVLSEQKYSFLSRNILFSGDFTEEKFQMNMQCDLTIKSFMAQKIEYVKNKSSKLNLNLIVNNDSSTIAINNGDLSIGDMKFTVVGNYSNHTQQNLNLLINGNNIQLSQAFSVFPIDYLSVLERYRSRGELEFNATVNGDLGINMPLRFISTFNVKDGSFIALGNDVALEGLNLSGKFDNKKGKLELNNFSGNMGNEKVSGSLSIEKFNEPFVRCDINGGLDFDILSKFFPNLKESISGRARFLLKADVKFDKNKTSIKKIVGELKSENTELKFNDLVINFSDLNLKTNNDNLNLKDLKGQLGKDNFKGNIILYDWVNSLFGYRKDLKLSSDLDFSDLDLESLIKLIPVSTDTSQNNRTYNLTSKINIKNLFHRKFKANNVYSDWSINSKEISCKKIKFNGQGGDYELKGKWINNNIQLSGNIYKVKVDKLFESFSNFNQSFLTNEQIKGNSNLSFNINLPLSINNEFDFSKMNINSNISFKGELIGHPFLRELLDYFNENPITKSIVDYSYFSKKIKKVVFEEFSTDVTVLNGKVYLPKTQLNNNVLNMNISGWQSFNDSIDYHLNFNWRELRQKSVQEDEFGEIKDDGLGKQVFLNIRGTIEDPIYKLDQSQKKEIRKEKVKEEKEQIKSILKGEEIVKKDTLESKPKFEVTWGEEDTSAVFDSQEGEEEKPQKKKKDSTKINKWLKKLGVEEKQKEKPVFEIDN
jgi:hypothetical protein